MRNVELCACTTIGTFVERQAAYHCSTCGKAVPDPDDPTRPAMVGRFDGPGGGKVLRVVGVEQEGAVPAEPGLSFETYEALRARVLAVITSLGFGYVGHDWEPGARGFKVGCLNGIWGEEVRRALEASGFACEDAPGERWAFLVTSAPPDPLASAREALAARCPGTNGPHVCQPLGTNGWQCSGCGLTLTEATLRALEAKPGPPKAAPLGGPAAFYAAMKVAVARGEGALAAGSPNHFGDDGAGDAPGAV